MCRADSAPVLAMALLALPGLAMGATLIVDLDGTSGFATPQEALDVAYDGDTILARPGTYESSLFFGGKSVTLRGSHGRGATWIRPPCGGPGDLSGVVDGGIEDVTLVTACPGEPYQDPHETPPDPASYAILANDSQAALTRVVVLDEVGSGFGVVKSDFTWGWTETGSPDGLRLRDIARISRGVGCDHRSWGGVGAPGSDVRRFVTLQSSGLGGIGVSWIGVRNMLAIGGPPFGLSVASSRAGPGIKHATLVVDDSVENCLPNYPVNVTMTVWPGWSWDGEVAPPVLGSSILAGGSDAAIVVSRGCDWNPDYTFPWDASWNDLFPAEGADLVMDGMDYDCSVYSGYVVYYYPARPYPYSFPVDENGNLSVDPQFMSWSKDGDLMNDDFSLAPGSPLIDAGDPDELDPDGTRADIGAFGGPCAFSREEVLDQDHDGFMPFMGDCDDLNPAAYPRAPGDVRGDGVDTDCDLVDGIWEPADGEGPPPPPPDACDALPPVVPWPGPHESGDDDSTAESTPDPTPEPTPDRTPEPTPTTPPATCGACGDSGPSPALLLAFAGPSILRRTRARR